MTELQTETIQKPKKAKTAKKKAKRAPKPFVAPAEFEGMTATECCNACYDNMELAKQAQRRLNEIEMMYPRRLAPPIIHPVTGWRMPAATVMEADEQYLARNPQIVEEYKELGKTLLGKCHITGRPGCAHPHKGGLSPNSQHDAKAVASYQRAKKVLAHQKINMSGTA